MCYVLQRSKKMFRLISTFLLCSQFLGLKADLDAMVLDVTFEYYDPYYFKDMEANVWNNEVFMNFTIINYLPLEAEVRIQIIGATMGEYKVRTGIDSTLFLCESMEEPIFVRYVLNYADPPMDDCPPKLGTYVASFKVDDYRTFPDTFIPNNYLVKMTIHISGKLILEIHAYVSTR